MKYYLFFLTPDTLLMDYHRNRTFLFYSTNRLKIIVMTNLNNNSRMTNNICFFFFLNLEHYILINHAIIII